MSMNIDIHQNMKLTDEQIDRYLSSYGMACPYCGLTEEQSNKFNEYGLIELEDNHYQKVTCGNCGKSWYEVYTFTGIEAFEEEDE